MRARLASTLGRDCRPRCRGLGVRCTPTPNCSPSGTTRVRAERPSLVPCPEHFLDFADHSLGRVIRDSALPKLIRPSLCWPTVHIDVLIEHDLLLLVVPTNRQHEVRAHLARPPPRKRVLQVPSHKHSHALQLVGIPSHLSIVPDTAICGRLPCRALPRILRFPLVTARPCRPVTETWLAPDGPIRVAGVGGCVRVGGVRVRWFARRGGSSRSGRHGRGAGSSGLRGAWCGGRRTGVRRSR